MLPKLTVGAFIKEKMGNMARWLTEEIGKENLSIDLESFVSQRSEVEMTFLAERIAENRAAIIHTDWQRLVTMLNADNALPEHVLKDFMQLIMAVRERKALHEKFWRYMQLLCTVVNSDAVVSGT